MKHLTSSERNNVTLDDETEDDRIDSTEYSKILQNQAQTPDAGMSNIPTNLLNNLKRDNISLVDEVDKLQVQNRKLRDQLTAVSNQLEERTKSLQEATDGHQKEKDPESSYRRKQIQAMDDYCGELHSKNEVQAVQMQALQQQLQHLNQHLVQQKQDLDSAEETIEQQKQALSKVPNLRRSCLFTLSLLFDLYSGCSNLFGEHSEVHKEFSAKKLVNYINEVKKNPLKQQNGLSDDNLSFIHNDHKSVVEGLKQLRKVNVVHNMSNVNNLNQIGGNGMPAQPSVPSGVPLADIEIRQLESEQSLSSVTTGTENGQLDQNYYALKQKFDDLVSKIEPLSATGKEGQRTVIDHMMGEFLTELGQKVDHQTKESQGKGSQNHQLLPNQRGIQGIQGIQEAQNRDKAAIHVGRNRKNSPKRSRKHGRCSGSPQHVNTANENSNPVDLSKMHQQSHQQIGSRAYSPKHHQPRDINVRSQIMNFTENLRNEVQPGPSREHPHHNLKNYNSKTRDRAQNRSVKQLQKELQINTAFTNGANHTQPTHLGDGMGLRESQMEQIRSPSPTSRFVQTTAQAIQIRADPIVRQRSGSNLGSGYLSRSPSYNSANMSYSSKKSNSRVIHIVRNLNGQITSPQNANLLKSPAGMSGKKRMRYMNLKRSRDQRQSGYQPRHAIAMSPLNVSAQKKKQFVPPRKMESGRGSKSRSASQESLWSKAMGK